MSKKTAVEERPEAKTKKKGKGKLALKIIAIILAVIIAAAGVCAAASAIGNKGNYKLANSFEKVNYQNGQLIPEKDENGDWCFTTDKDFKVIQLTDVHIGGGFMSLKKDAGAVTAVATMLKKEAPDLVIVTGDIAYPVPFQAGTFNNKVGAKMLAELMEALGIYWTLGYGNHDTEIYSYFTREDISDFYTSGDYSHCLFQVGPEDIDGFGNQIIKVKNSDGIITQAFFVFDSHTYTNGDFLGILWKYDNIHENQVQWYKDSVLAMNEYNTKLIKASKDFETKYADFETVKSLAFFHIPLVEYYDAWNEFAANGYKDTENVKYNSGMIGETGKAIYCGVGEDDLFETILELGSTKAIFCGHDHFNNISITYKGIDLNYGNSIDYLAYAGISQKGSQRGCVCITVSPDGTYTSDWYNIYTSGRYDLPEGFADGVAFQFEDVTYQYFEEK